GSILGLDEVGNEPLIEVHLLVGSEPHENARMDCAGVWLDVGTGRLNRQRPDQSGSGYLHLFIPASNPSDIGGKKVITFRRCPICLKRMQSSRNAIMDLATKGEAPFANLVRAQLLL